jgi:hypothetical protein
MRVTFEFGSAAPVTTSFEPSDHKWQQQNQLHTIWDNTGLPTPLERVFVKRWHMSAATGDELMRAAIGTKIAGTPRIYGYATDGQDHYYFIECLPPSYKKLSDLIERSADGVLKRGVAQRLVNQSYITFTKLNERGFIYCDLRSDNVMYNTVARSVSFIDLDSCMSTKSLVAREGKPIQGVDIAYWGLFNTYVPHRTGWDPEEVQKTLVLSAAAIWARAVAVYALSERVAAVKLLTSPVLNEQLELWEAIKARRKASFENYFQLRQVRDEVFVQWCNLFESFRSLRPAEWNSVRSAVKSLLDDVQAAGGLERRPSPVRPKPVLRPLPPVAAPVTTRIPKWAALFLVFALLVLLIGFATLSHSATRPPVP